MLISGEVLWPEEKQREELKLRQASHNKIAFTHFLGGRAKIKA